jgi:thymidylate synthase
MKALYKPNPEPDLQYRQALRTILAKGVQKASPTGTDTISYPGIMMRFPVENGAPVTTLRTLAPEWKKTLTVWRQAVGEIFAFVNGVRTLDGLKEFGCHWWRHWVNEEKCSKRGLETGDLGPGSYGPAFHDFPTIHATADGQVARVNQFEEVLHQMRQQPHLKTHFISPWVAGSTYRGRGNRKQEVVVCPCHGWIHFMVDPEGGLTLLMFQRSGDMPVGVPSNHVQYFALLLAVAQVLDLRPKEFVHMVSDAHIYVNQVPQVEEMLGRREWPFPQMTINPDVKDLFAFRHEHFALENYNPHGDIKFPVAV